MAPTKALWAHPPLPLHPPLGHPPPRPRTRRSSLSPSPPSIPRRTFPAYPAAPRVGSARARGRGRGSSLCRSSCRTPMTPCCPPRCGHCGRSGGRCSLPPRAAAVWAGGRQRGTARTLSASAAPAAAPASAPSCSQQTPSTPRNWESQSAPSGESRAIGIRPGVGWGADCGYIVGGEVGIGWKGLDSGYMGRLTHLAGGGEVRLRLRRHAHAHTVSAAALVLLVLLLLVVVLRVAVIPPPATLIGSADVGVGVVAACRTEGRAGVRPPLPLCRCPCRCPCG